MYLDNQVMRARPPSFGGSENKRSIEERYLWIDMSQYAGHIYTAMRIFKEQDRLGAVYIENGHLVVDVGNLDNESDQQDLLDYDWKLRDDGCWEIKL